MRVALAVDNNMITEHFGHCEYFVIHEIEGKEVKGTEIVKNPPHQKGFLPKFLKQHSVDVVITGNIGKMAIGNLESLGIECYLGVHGEMQDILNRYLEGTLESGSEVCSEHMHHHGHGHDH